MELGTLVKKKKKNTLYLVFQPHIFPNTCSLTLSQTVSKGQDVYGAYALEKIYCAPVSPLLL